MHTSFGKASSDLWVPQWGRVINWHQKIKLEKKKHNDSHGLSGVDMDVVYAFFQNCYHLRDWILNSNPKLQHKIEEYFKNHIEMQICQDICNGLKHMDISRPKIDPDFSFYREYDHFAAETQENPIKYNIIAGGYKYDIFELIDKLVALWEEFIDLHLRTKKTRKETE